MTTQTESAAGTDPNCIPTPNAEECARTVRKIIQMSSVAAAAIAVQPFPFGDIALLAPLHIAMVRGIGHAHGYMLDSKAVLEMLSSFGASLVTRSVVVAACKLIPGFGWVVAISMNYALTYAIGEASDHYFRTGRGASASELRSKFESSYTRTKAQKEAEHGKNGSLRERLEQLKSAFAAGMLTEEEFTRAKEELLRSF